MSQLNVDILAADLAGAAESWVDKLVAERVASEALRAQLHAEGINRVVLGYLAVQAYLDRVADAAAEVLRTELARRTGRQEFG